MDVNTIVGCVLLAASLLLLLVLVWFSRRRIDRIAKRGYRSAREIVKDLRDA